jgi:hypothetical protein
MYPDPDSTPDPTPFFIDFKDEKKFHIFFLPQAYHFVLKILFCRHYFSPLKIFMRKVMIRIRIRIHTSDNWIRIRIQEAQKYADPADPDPQQYI